MKNQIIIKKLKYALGLVLLFGAMSCSDELIDLGPSATTNAKPGSGVTPPAAFVYTLPTFGTACETDAEYCFDAFFKNKGGNDLGGPNSITVTISVETGNTGDITSLDPANPQVVGDNSGHFCFSGLAAGTYTVSVSFIHTPSGKDPVNASYSFTLTVQSAEVCDNSTGCSADGVSLTRSVTDIDADIDGKVISVCAHYTVKNCSDEKLEGLKLQGGLVNKATILKDENGDPIVTATGGAESVVYTLKTSKGNNILSWTFDLPAGGEEIFSVCYNVWGVSCDSPLSGAWSLKNSAGTPIGVSSDDESAISAGYLDRLYWDCD